MPSVAVVIIGNEILSGKFADENGPFAIHLLRERGVDLGRLVVIPDVVDGIAAEVAACSAAFDHVVTSGGVGPTHDDLTMVGVGAAFGLPVRREPELAARLERRFGAGITPETYRMAEIPHPAELWWDDTFPWPVVVVRNVAILPGVPGLFRRKLEAVVARFGGSPVTSRRLVTESTEPVIAAVLDAAAAAWPEVAIGSYPRFETDPHTVIITMEGRNLDAIAACEEFLAARIPPVPTR